MELTAYPYTVYCAGEVVDIATESELHELMHIFKEVEVNYKTMVVTIVE